MADAAAQADNGGQSITTYNWCKKEAFDYGAIGNYRRLFVLSCLSSDMTAAIPGSGLIACPCPGARLTDWI